MLPNCDNSGAHYATLWPFGITLGGLVAAPAPQLSGRSSSAPATAPPLPLDSSNVQHPGRLRCNVREAIERHCRIALLGASSIAAVGTNSRDAFLPATQRVTAPRCAARRIDEDARRDRSGAGRAMSFGR